MNLIDRDALMKEFTKFVRRSNNHDYTPAPTWNDAVSLVGSMSSAEPDNQVHLCGFCKYGYPECPAGMSDVIFGNGKGQDNVCACAKFEIKPERKKGELLKEDLSGYLTPGGNSIYHCSECGHTEGPWPHPRLTNFCPSCGADMRGE